MKSQYLPIKPKGLLFSNIFSLASRVGFGVFLFCSNHFLTGCTGGGGTGDAGESTPRAMLSDLIVGDSGLQNCLLDVMEGEGILYVDELVKLTCRELIDGDGLEQLKALEVLEINYANQAVVDYLDLTSLTSLKEFSMQALNITSINFSGSPDLEVIHTFGVPLKAIDITRNPSLRTLTVALSEISQIDLSNNPKLEELDLYDTNLSEIDLSSNFELKDIDLALNDIQEVDFSNNIHVTRLRIRRTSIANIDVSLMSNLIWLDIWSPITSLDVSHNLELKHLKILDAKMSCEKLRDIARLNQHIDNVEIPPACIL